MAIRRSTASSDLGSPLDGYKTRNCAGRVTIGLNKGEVHQTLKWAIRFYRRGSVGDRTQLDRDVNAMVLNLVVAGSIFWNAAYLDPRAL